MIFFTLHVYTDLWKADIREIRAKTTRLSNSVSKIHVHQTENNIMVRTSTLTNPY